MPVLVVANFFREMRYSARSLARTPAWTLSLVLTIALGIGSAASVDGFVRGFMSQGPPLPGDVVSVLADGGPAAGGALSYDQYDALRSRSDVFASVGAVRETQDEAWLNNRRLLVAVATVTPAVADLLQLPGDGGIVVSHRVWYDDFVSVPVEGHTMRMHGADLPVVGVAPQWLTGLYRGRPIDIWMRAPDAAPVDRATASYWVVGRVREGVAPDAAERSAGGLAVLPYTGLLPDAADGMARIARLLRVSAIAVFAIACANVASFLLSRASARLRETAVRVAIGARRRQLIRQVLADSVLISILGGAMGAVLAMWLGRIVPAMLFDQDAEQMIFAADPWSVAWIAIACAATTMACGLLPLIETRDDPNAIIQRESAGPSRASIRLNAGLVVVQMTACTLLIISAGLLVAGLRSALQTTAGRRLSNPVLASVDALQMSSKSHEATSGLAYFAGVEGAARDVAGAFSSAWVATVPGNRPVWQSYEFERANLVRRLFEFERVPYVTKTIEDIVLPPIEGRMFATRDTGPCGGVVVSREAGRRLGVERVVGRSIETPEGEWVEIVGVVAPRDEPDAARVYHYAPEPRRDGDAGTSSGDEPGRSMGTFRFPQLASSALTVLDVNVVSANYFQFMGLPTIAGRTFADVPGACRVAIVNREAADLYFNGDAVGGAFIDRLGRRTSIIGVVGSTTLRVSQRGVTPAVYFPLTQDFQPRMTMIMETNGVDRATLRRLRARIATIPGGRENRIIVTTLDDHLSRTALVAERIATVLVGASATIALMLGMLGLYGVMADAARRRQREFALRIALGAQGGHVVGQVMVEGMRLVAVGTAAGIASSFLVSRWLAQIAPTDALSPLVWLSAPVLLALAVVTASVIPARAAAASDPLLIMKDDR
jgi:putative ABC transport system permease protein